MKLLVCDGRELEVREAPAPESFRLIGSAIQERGLRARLGFVMDRWLGLDLGPVRRGHCLAE